MRPSGKEGFLYGVKFETVITGGPNVTISKSGWYKIKSRAGSDSGIPDKDPDIERGEALKAGDFYFAQQGQPLVQGDALIPMTLKKLSFTTDVSAAAQGQAIDVTTQIDVELVDVDSEEQRLLVSEFSQVNVQDGGHVSVSEAGSRVHHFMISYRESRTPGETEMWRYFPVIVESFQMDKPIDGSCPFNFNYKVDGQSGPGMYYRTVPESEITAEPEEFEESSGDPLDNDD